MSSPRPSSMSGSGHLSASPNEGKGHHHSYSSGGMPQTAAGPKSNLRASMDAARGIATATGLGFGRSSNAQRPMSELLQGSNASFNDSSESEAIDKWFEDLQHYQNTLEEMATASLDQNFKEELSAIEQWFVVLSEAERTAALYSLLQSSTPVQIRFFITVLQQMCGDQPNAAMMSPRNPQGGNLEAQMEAKLNSLGFKGGAAAASPAAKQFARMSLNAPTNNNNSSDFLSPNAADNSSGAATLAQQRAKLNKAQSHRISAPGTLASNWAGNNNNNNSNDMKSPLYTQNEVNERRSPSPSGQRPKSTGSDLGSVSRGQNSANIVRSPNLGGNPLDEHFSPMVGNWSSQVNTPLVPMFTEQETQSPNLDISNASNKLANWGAQHQNAGNNANNAQGAGVVQLDDAKKFRRSGRVGVNDNVGMSTPTNQTRRATSATLPNMPTSPSATSQQAALSAQANWRNTNGLSPSLSGGMPAAGINGNMTPQEITSALMQQQSMMQAQLQLQQNLLMMNGLMSPNMSLNQSQGAGGAFPQMSPLMSASSSWGSRSGRSPRPDGQRFPSNNNTPAGPHGNRTPSSAHHVVGSGVNPDEDIDVKLLKDVPAWLRALRLHKYTNIFEKSNWEDMVKMDDAALEQAGVAALGARRKLLKVFGTVRHKVWGEPKMEDTGNESADVTGINTTLGDTTTLDIGNGSDESHLEGKTNAPKREDSTSSIHSQGSA